MCTWSCRDRHINITSSEQVRTGGTLYSGMTMPNNLLITLSQHSECNMHTDANNHNTWVKVNSTTEHCIADKVSIILPLGQLL